MKFRIISAIVLLIALVGAYLLFNDSTPSQSNPQDGGLTFQP